LFKLKRPCSNCPFRKDKGRLFGLDRSRLIEITNGLAFQCHKTVDYDKFDDPEGRQGDKPQQCAGLMTLLHRAGRPNAIMQVAERLGHLDPTALDPDKECYETIAEAIEGHTLRRARHDTIDSRTKEIPLFCERMKV
jgi:hypothetical protein